MNTNVSGTVSASMTARQVPPVVIPPCGGDLAVEILRVVETAHQENYNLRGVAQAHGVSPNTMLTMLLVSVVEQWLARQPQITPEPPLPDVRASAEVSSLRSAQAMLDNTATPLTLRLPPLLAIRLCQLAGGTRSTVESAAVAVLGRHTDHDYSAFCRAEGLPPPHTWEGGDSTR
jgi:hypothetical protein